MIDKMASFKGLVTIFVLVWNAETLIGQQSSGQFQGQFPSSTPEPLQTARVLLDLAGVTKARTALVTKIQQYRNQLAEIKVQEEQAKAQCLCRDRSQVVFTSFLNDNVPTFGQQQTMPFTNVTFNAGNAYNARIAQFRAPVNGTYIFFVTIATESGYQLVVDIVKDGTPVIKVRCGNDKQWNTSTNTVVLHLTSGQDVWVQHDKSISDSNRLFKGEGLYSSFTGHLIERDY